MKPNSNAINSKKSGPRHSIVKLLKTKDKEKVLKASERQLIWEYQFKYQHISHLKTWSPEEGSINPFKC